MTTPPITCPIPPIEVLADDGTVLHRLPHERTIKDFAANCASGGKIYSYRDSTGVMFDYRGQPIATAGEPKGGGFVNISKFVEMPSPASTETRQDSEDSWNAVAASGEREQPAPTLKESFRAEAFARAKTMHKVVHRVAFDALFDEIWNAIESYHQLARAQDKQSLALLRLKVKKDRETIAQDKARIAGLEGLLRVIQSDMGRLVNRLGDLPLTRQLAMDVGSAIAAELNRNTEK